MTKKIVKLDQEIIQLKSEVAETKFVEELRRELGNEVIAVSVVRNGFREAGDVEKKGKSKKRKKKKKPRLLILMTDIKIGLQEVTRCISQQFFSHNALSELLQSDLRVEETRLVLSKGLNKKSIRNLFREIKKASRREDLTAASATALEGIISEVGGSGDLYVDTKMCQLSEKRSSMDENLVKKHLKSLLLQREIMRRDAQIQRIAEEALGPLNIRQESIHLSFLREELCEDTPRIVGDLATGLLFDRGLVGRLAAALDHKERLEQEFEDKYFAGYAIFGSWITKQELAETNSDLDCLVLIDDFDVKNMGYSELKSKLQVGVDRLAIETATQSGLPGFHLHNTTFLLSEAWRSIYEGNVVLLSILDRAFVLHDPRRLIRIWQILLNSGRLAPSETTAHHLLESGGESILRVNDRMRKVVTDDLYPGVLAAAQGILVRLGERLLPPDIVIEKLRSYASNGARDVASADKIEKIALSLEDLLGLYSNVKRHPTTRIEITRLGKLVARAERAIEVAEEICGELKNLSE